MMTKKECERKTARKQPFAVTKKEFSKNLRRSELGQGRFASAFALDRGVILAF